MMCFISFQKKNGIFVDITTITNRKTKFYSNEKDFSFDGDGCHGNGM